MRPEKGQVSESATFPILSFDQNIQNPTKGIIRIIQNINSYGGGMAEGVGGKN